MITLPEPEDLTSLVIRTEFGNDVAWEMLQAEIDSSHEPEDRFATYISDPAFTGVTVLALLEAESVATEEAKVFYLFLADATCLVDREHRLLAVDLSTQPGRTFRVPPRCFADVSANLSIANMDFGEFADAADDSGTFRGFDGD